MASGNSKISQKILNRTGAVRRSEIPSKVLELLEQGKIDTKNLVEMLALDFGKLLKVIVKDLDATKVKSFSREYKKIADEGIMQRLKGVGRIFHELADDKAERSQWFAEMSAHVSDIVRSWACFMILADMSLKLSTRLNRVKKFAADSHMGVKECAWFSMRPYVVENFDQALPLLVKWVQHKNPDIRRCAIEGVRPRGVWTQHFELLKKNPQKALPLLEPCLSDESRYVQNALANWLNDASKSQPEWVKDVCQQWLNKSDSKETQYIVKRALRTLNKK